MTLVDDAHAALAALGTKNRAFNTRYPGERDARQPIHTVYGGAHLFKADTAPKLGQLARHALRNYEESAFLFAEELGVVPEGSLEGVSEARARVRLAENPERLRRSEPLSWLALVVFDRVKQKLAREAVEDFRIDFEDGFGARSDDEEDAAARIAALEVACGLEGGTLPPFIGIRVKSLSEEWKVRAARTLELFVGTLLEKTGGRLPPNFVVTLPKITIPEQASTLVTLFELLERRHGLAPGALRMEIMIEVTQALLAADGRSPLPAFLDACQGRCVGAHLGTYDFTASCNITAAYQSMAHPLCDLAKGMMTLAYAGTGVFLSDGATNIMPVEPHDHERLSPHEARENREAVRAALRISYEHVRHSLENGFYQGWDLHPAQLPVRYAASYAFFLEGLGAAEEWLANFVEKAARATLAGDVFDDAATGQGLLNYFLRALNSGAIEPADAARTGLTPEELAMRSFARILAARKQRGAG
jgi:citrate lyase beta subunit